MHTCCLLMHISKIYLSVSTLYKSRKRITSCKQCFWREITDQWCLGMNFPKSGRSDRCIARNNRVKTHIGIRPARTLRDRFRISRAVTGVTFRDKTYEFRVRAAFISRDSGHVNVRAFRDFARRVTMRNIMRRHSAVKQLYAFPSESTCASYSS